MARNGRRTPKKKKKHNALYGPLMFIIVCAALIFGMSVFFRVSKVEVTGNSLYTEEEIVAASGIESGDNLFFINRFSAAGRILVRLPYVEDATVTRLLPNKVVIDISESNAIAYLAVKVDVLGETGASPAPDATPEPTPTPTPTPEPTQTPEPTGEPQDDAPPEPTGYFDYWIIDRNGKFLTKANASEVVGLIEIRGLTPIAPKVGAVISPGEAEMNKVAYLKEILNQIQERGLQNQVTYVDISNVSNPSFDFDGRFTVKLGADSETEYKFGMLLSAVEQMEPGDQGTIDISLENSQEKKAVLSP